MKNNVWKYFGVLLLLMSVNKVFATAQFGDLLIIKKDTIWIYSNPLEGYFKKKGARTIGNTEMYGNCTALWRGYVATWKLENDSLFLIRVQTNYCGDNPIDIDISDEFGTKKVFAKWVNSTIVRPEGQLLDYVHMGYSSIYEREIFYSFTNGLLSKQEQKDYLIQDDNLVFPGKRFLRDSIRTLILKAIPLENRQDFNEENSCRIFIAFNEQGQIEVIDLSYNKKVETLMQKTILSTTKDVLKNFPPLMKVNHDGYHPPRIELWFSGHCLKYPYDREYGCNYE